MAAYWDLAPEQNLDPTRDALHSSLQQSRVRFLHVQCFCLSQKPIPLTDQVLLRRRIPIRSHRRRISCYSMGLAENK